MKLYNRLLILILLLTGGNLHAQKTTDPYLWLEEVDGKKALDWVKSKNAGTVEKLKQHTYFESMQAKSLEILNSKDRIAMPMQHGSYIYNFWMDATNERGIWRRCSVNSYLSANPEWETVLDIDKLSKEEHEKWVYKGADFLFPDNKLCLVQLSRGGGDATVIREFDLVKKEFVRDGFFVPEAKNSVSWKDENTLYLGTNFGDGSMTESGYPRIAKIWKRGTKISEATVLFAGNPADVSVSAYVVNAPERDYHFLHRGITFYTSELYADYHGQLIKMNIPDDAEFSGIFKNQFILELKSDWNVGNTTYKQGSVLSINFDSLLFGGNNFTVLLTPDEKSSINEISGTKDYLLINLLHNVSSQLYRYSFTDGKWSSEKVNAPDFGDISIISSDSFSDLYFFTYRSFLAPTTLYRSDASGVISKVRELPSYFNTTNLMVEQFQAVSADGVKIPYFVIKAKDTKTDGSNPTVILAYGGFEVSYRPFYSGLIGSNWLERGGVFVLANLRGGGEFGPQWHVSAIKENRQKVNDDLIAVSEDLIQRGITSPKHLGIQGGSNGGLLVGSVYLQRPDLYNAVLCQVPLLDMKRYHRLLAGASWVGEYGNPDKPEEWAYISKYSPYQNLKAGMQLPPIFLVTSTRDDRVHPAHARKFGAKLDELGYPFFYYENTEGGHGSGVTNKQIAFEYALQYAYLWQQLGR